MEDNNDMSGASALETHPIGETGGVVSAIFRDGNDITQGGPSKAKYKKSTLLFFSQSDTHDRAVWLMYLVIVDLHLTESIWNICYRHSCL